MTFALRLRSERCRLAMSQTAFAAWGGVSKRSQIMYEQGRASPSAAYLELIARRGVDVSYVLTGKRAHRPDARPAQAITPAQRAALDAAHDALRRLQLDLETLGRDSPKNVLLERALEDNRRHLRELDGLRSALQTEGATPSPQPAPAGAPSPAPGGAGAF